MLIEKHSDWELAPSTARRCREDDGVRFEAFMIWKGFHHDGTAQSASGVFIILHVFAARAVLGRLGLPGVRRNFRHMMNHVRREISTGLAARAPRRVVQDVIARVVAGAPVSPAADAGAAGADSAGAA